jgi:hypothetical protein
METSRATWGLMVGLSLVLGPGASRAEPVGTGFLYQGLITDGHKPANGLHDFQFKLFDASIEGQQIADTIEVNDVNVVDGHFAVELDFSSQVASPGHVAWDIFNGDARWLEVAVRPARGDQSAEMDQALATEAAAPVPYTVLLPRQRIAPTPYALRALSGGGLYDVLRWPSNWSLGTEETPKPPGDAGGQSLLNVGKLGIGTTSPACPLDVAGAANLNQGKTGIALTVNGKEALWCNDTYFSWGYGGSANHFADPVGIGLGVTDPAERLDLSWSGGVNARIGRYNYLGSCFSSATLVLGNNVRARTDSVNGIVVGNPHETYGYRALVMSLDGIQFYGRAGTVKAGDPLDAATERMRVTNDGNVGIGTTSPKDKLDVAGHVNCSGSYKVNGYILLAVRGTRSNTLVGEGAGVNIPAQLPSDNHAVTNTAVGYQALYGDATGGGNTAIGGFALHDNTSGSMNTVLGDGAGWQNTGSGNVFIGHSTAYHETGSNKLYIANSMIDPPLIYGEFDKKALGINTKNLGGYTLAVNGTAAKSSGGSWASLSDARLKDIHGRFERGLSEVTRLSPVRCSYRPDNGLNLPAGTEFVGLVAQEVRTVVPEAVQENSDGYLMVNNDPIIWTMLNAIKELSAQNEQLRQTVELLENRPAQVVKDLRSENESLQQRLARLERRMELVERDSSRIAQGVRP